MTLVLSTDDAIVINDATLNDAPAVRMTGSRIRFTNSESGRVVSATNATPAITIEGNGGTIINEFGGIIRLSDPLSAGAAANILGSLGNDIVMNSGVIGGRVALGDGNDEFHLLDNGQIAQHFLGYAVDLGAGNDTYFFAPATTGNGYVSADGGTGIDRLVMDGPRQNFGGFVANIEILDLRTNGFFEGMTGFERIEVMFATAGHNFSAIRFMNTPLADVIVGGTALVGQSNRVSIYDRSTVQSVQGNVFANTVDIGTDTVISGNIALGAGDDWLTFYRSQFSNPVLQSIGAVIDGGSGTDTLTLNMNGGDSFNLSNMVGFERVNITNLGQWNEPLPPPNYMVSVSGISGVAEIQIFTITPFNGSPILPVTLSAISSAAGALRLNSRAIVTLQSDVTFGTITHTSGVPQSTLPADDTQSINITNRGLVIGDVQLWVGDDIFNSAEGSATGIVFGYAGNDSLTGGIGYNRFEGGAGGDILDGGIGADLTDGGTGNDLHFVDNAGDVVVERAGEGTADRVVASISYQLPFFAEVEILEFNAAVAGGALNLTGSNTANSILGGGGVNVLTGLGGADALYGLGGADQLYGDEGDDYLSGGEGADYLSGGAGNDLMLGGSGTDTVLGGSGDDSYYQITSDDIIVEYDGQGNDRIFTEVDYSLRAGSYVETLSTTSNVGTTAINLTGNELNNVVIGNAGVNQIDGGLGADSLYGGAGLDYFYFTSALNTGNVDALGDFASVDDILMIDRRMFTGGGLAAGFLDASAFLSGAGATTATAAAHRFVHDSTTGDIYFDADGAGGAAAVKFANIGAGTAIQYYDLFVI